MIDQGVNPHIRDFDGDTQYDLRSLSHLNNITPLKSVYFIIKMISSDVAGNPWRYQNGIYPATFTDVIEQRDEGSVLGGELDGGKKVVFKFVKQVVRRLADLETKLSEMSTMNDVAGSCALKILGHYR